MQLNLKNKNIAN